MVFKNCLNGIKTVYNNKARRLAGFIFHYIFFFKDSFQWAYAAA